VIGFARIFSWYIDISSLSFRVSFAVYVLRKYLVSPPSHFCHANLKAISVFAITINWHTYTSCLKKKSPCHTSIQTL
jgi:hypothetical protein